MGGFFRAGKAEDSQILEHSKRPVNNLRLAAPQRQYRDFVGKRITQTADLENLGNETRAVIVLGFRRWIRVSFSLLVLGKVSYRSLCLLGRDQRR
jgi:hypothetical protein